MFIGFWSPTTKNVYSLGYRSQKSIHFGAFRSRLHPPPCLIRFEFLVTFPYFIHFQPFVWNEGGLTFIHYVWWGLKESPESCSTKNNRQFSNPVPFIHFELPGRLSGGPTEYYQILHDSHDCKNRALDRALWCSPSCKKRALACESCYRQWARHNIYIYLFIYNYLHVSVYMWMFCNHRSAQPCLYTFFIVFRRVPPHRFHTFLVNMIRHPHGIPPPVLYTFVIFCHCHLSVILWNSSENLFFPVFVRGYVFFLMHTFSKMYETRPPQFFGLHWVMDFVSKVFSNCVSLR